MIGMYMSEKQETRWEESTSHMSGIPKRAHRLLGGRGWRGRVVNIFQKGFFPWGRVEK